MARPFPVLRNTGSRRVWPRETSASYVYRVLQNGCHERHLTHDSPLNFDLTLSARVTEDVARIATLNMLNGGLYELLPQEHVFKPERPLIAQMLTAKVGSKFRGESRQS